MATLHKHGINALVYIGGTELAGGNSWRVSVVTSNASAAYFGQKWVDVDQGVKSWSGNLTAFSESNAQLIQTAAVATTSTALLLYPDRNDTNDYYSGSAHFGMQPQSGAQARSTVDGDFVGDGALTVAGFS